MVNALAAPVRGLVQGERERTATATRFVNHAHARNAAKRGGGSIRVTLDESYDRTGDADAVLLDLTDALDALEKIDPRKVKLIELQYFGGFSLAEMEEATGLSPATIGRDLRFARAWLKDQMTGKDE